MRSPVVLLLVALAGVLSGGALIGLPALGACLIFDSLALGAWGIVHYDWPEHPGARAVPQPGLTLADVLDRARAS